MTTQHKYNLLSNLGLGLTFFFCLCTLSTFGIAPDKYELTFRSSVVYGSQKNDLSIYVSTDFKGGNSLESINTAGWENITGMATLSEGSAFVESGTIDISKLSKPGQPLFIAFRYSAPAAPKPTQRMWRITRLNVKHNNKALNLSEWLFINHEANDENVGWEKMEKVTGVQYRSRMTKKQSESWAIVQVLLPNTQNVIGEGNAQTRTTSANSTTIGTKMTKPNQTDSPNASLVTREDLKAAMYKAYLASGPGPEIAKQLGQMEVLEKVKVDGYERWHVKYKVDQDEYAYAFILLPLDYAQRGKLPLMLCPHPTYNPGKNRVVNLYDEPAKDKKDQAKREARQYAVDLVKRGFAVFAPDRAGYGERRLLLDKGYKENMSAFSKKMREKYPKFGLNGKAIWDLKVGLDLMLAYNFVDSKNIGIIGHSLGAWDAILFSAMDDRVKATVTSSGGMVAYLPELWTEDQTALKSYLNSPSQQSLTKNTNIFLMLNASRSVLYTYSLRDPYYKGQPQLVDGYPTIYQYYKTHNPQKRADISYFLHNDGHDFPPAIRAATYIWLEERLMTQQ